VPGRNEQATARIEQKIKAINKRFIFSPF